MDHAIWRGSGRIVGFREAITVCIQDYYTFSGRARRSEYWWFFLFLLVASNLLAVVDVIVFGEGMVLGLSGLFALLALIPQLAVAWRRMHDTGRPGWFNLLPMVPTVPLFIIGSGDPAPVLVLMYGSVALMIVVLVWLALPSQPMPNRFGPETPP